MNKDTADMMRDPGKFLARSSGFLLIVCGFVSLPILAILNVFRDRIGIAAYSVSGLAVPGLIAILLSAAFAYGYRNILDSGVKRCGIETGFLSFALVVCLYPAMALVSSLSSGLAPDSSAGADTVGGLLPDLPLPVSLLLLAALPAIGEELLCRGIIYGTFRRRSATAAFTVSTVGFAVMHGNPGQLAYTALFGVALCAVREISGSIWPCMLMHFTFNGVGVSLSYIPETTGETGAVAGAPIAEPTFWGRYGELIGLSAIGIGMAIGILLLMMRKNSYENGDTDKSMPAISITHILAWAISTILMIL